MRPPSRLRGFYFCELLQMMSASANAEQKGADAADFATTLTVVVLARGWLGHLALGDGFVVVRAGTEDGERQSHLLPRAAEAATLGGKFTRRWTWLSSPLNSTSSHSKSAHTDRMISSMRVR
ncbi:hypothetical protein GCM10010317_065760 [Streptomyces mirabilis]|nr:hypothetical protein GCM10010317_065760 [Streptomyces mirabilis]